MHNKGRCISADVWTQLDQMNLLDRFLFNETVEDPEIYRAVVEILMEGHIALLDWAQTEKELRVSPELRQVRLDVIGMDADGGVYQLEMQQNNTYNLPKRSRYYQGQIDVSLLDPGSVNFNELNDLTMILVAPFDIFGYGLYRYTFEEYCHEVPGLKLNDGARRIFINTNGRNSDQFSGEFLEFMEYINSTTDEIGAKTKSERIRQIHTRVRNIRKSEKMGVKLMQAWEQKIYDKMEARAEGLAEGRAEGLIEGRAEGLIEGRAEGRAEGLTEGRLRGVVGMVCRKLRRGLSLEEICELLEEPELLIGPMCEAAAAFAPAYDEEKVWEAYAEQR